MRESASDKVERHSRGLSEARPRPPEYFAGLEFWIPAVVGDVIRLDDRVPYRRQSFQNRARLRTPDGWQWITVPLKGRQRGTSIADIEIDNTVPWRSKHLRALQYNYRTSPYFEAYEDRFEDLLRREWLTLGSLTVTTVELVCNILELPAPESVRHEHGSPPSSNEERLDLAEEPHAGGVYSFMAVPYRQNFPGFEAGMSVLDAFFNLGHEVLDLIRAGIEPGDRT